VIFRLSTCRCTLYIRAVFMSFSSSLASSGLARHILHWDIHSHFSSYSSFLSYISSGLLSFFCGVFIMYLFSSAFRYIELLSLASLLALKFLFAFKIYFLLHFDAIYDVCRYYYIHISYNVICCPSFSFSFLPLIQAGHIRVHSFTFMIVAMPHLYIIILVYRLISS